jgi:hypothetical protein
MAFRMVLRMVFLINGRKKDNVASYRNLSFSRILVIHQNIRSSWTGGILRMSVFFRAPRLEPFNLTQDQHLKPRFSSTNK